MFEQTTTSELLACLEKWRAGPSAGNKQDRHFSVALTKNTFGAKLGNSGARYQVCIGHFSGSLHLSLIKLEQLANTTYSFINSVPCEPSSVVLVGTETDFTAAAKKLLHAALERCT